MSYGSKKGGGPKHAADEISVPKPQSDDEVPAESAYCAPEIKGTVQPNRELPTEAEALESDGKPRKTLEGVAKCLNKAFQGMGTDEKKIITVLAGHTNAQRQAIKKIYATNHGGKLEEHLSEELGGDFEELCLGLLMLPEDYSAFCLHEAVEGCGTNEDALIDLLCVASNQDIESMKNRYKAMYDKDLQTVVNDETSGDFQKLMVSLLQGNRSETTLEEVDKDQVQQDAEELYQAGEGKNIGTDESEFNRILVSRSRPHLKEMFKAYDEKADDRDIEKSIDSEFSGSVKDGLLAIVKHTKDPFSYWAERLHNCLTGKLLDPDEDAIMRIIISHSELDMVNIMNAYYTAYNERLDEACANGLLGDFKKLIVRLLNPNFRI